MKIFSPEISLSLLILFLISQLLLFYFLFCLEILIKQVTAVNTKIIFSFLLIIFSITACNTAEPPNDNQSVNLILEDVSCTEAWITLTTTNLQLPASVTLKQINPTSDTTSQILNLNTKDSLLYIDSLLPNQTYVFQSVIQSINQSSNELSITTMDTTSHNVIFETFTFGGQYQSSILYDVALINENSIWAVGEIYLLDSLGQPVRYNVVHWNGNEWTLHRIMFYTFCGQQHQNAYPASSIIAFSEGEIWIAMRGDQIAKIENDIQAQTICLPWSFTINKIWGMDSNNLYVVGNESNVAHYQNGQWMRIESGTDVDLKDIYGTRDGENIWISGYEDFKPTVLLKISNSIIEIVFNTRDYLSGFNPDHISGEITSVWTNSNNFVYVTTPYSLYRKSIYIDPSREEALRFGDPLSWLGRRSRGTEINNIFIAGNRGNVHHYNGVTFKSYQELANNGVTYYSLDVKNNLTVLCGQKFENGINDKAIITLTK